MPESEVGSSHYRVLFLAALVLFAFTFVANTVAELVRQRLRNKYSSL
jgi:phosphate transport system permease protein